MVSCVNVELFGRLPVKVPSAARSAPMEAAAGWAIGSQSHGRSRQSRAKKWKHLGGRDWSKTWQLFTRNSWQMKIHQNIGLGFWPIAQYCNTASCIWVFRGGYWLSFGDAGSKCRFCCDLESSGECLSKSHRNVAKLSNATQIWWHCTPILGPMWPKNYEYSHN